MNSIYKARKAKTASAPSKNEQSTQPKQRVDAECVQELTEQQAAFRARRERENTRITNMMDTEYWCCIVFPTRAEKDAFLQRHGLHSLGDKYINGRKADRILNARAGKRGDK